MTEYGRGPGSEPWHPEDPLYGDGGWGGQQAQEGQQSPYGGQPQHYPQQPQQQSQYGDWGDGGQGAYGQQQYDQYGQPIPEPQYDQYGQQQYDQQYAAQAQPQQDQGYDDGGWGTGAHPHAQYPGDPSDPYGQQSAAYGAEQPDFYGTPGAYPPPEPPGRRRAEPEPQGTDWDPGPDEGEHAFFAGGDAGESGDDGGSGGRRGRGGKQKKGRSGLACLVVCLVLGGGVAGVGYFGLQFYQDRFGAAPDYAGDGNGEKVTVTIPKGAGGATIGQELKRKGVVKSVDAFISAQQSNPNGKSIQDGVYTLQKEMSAASAVELLLSPESRSNLIIAEGWRNVQVYKKIDEQLGLKKGTTAGVAKAQWKNLGLPAWAMNHKNVKDPLEGFLYPSSYSAAKGQKPEDVLKQMVARANEKYQEFGLEQKAGELGLEGPWQLLTVASLAQAEGTSHDDFRRMAEVIYNRLKPGNVQTNGMLEFDSTYNYVKNQSKIDLSLSELRNYDNPYNTYYYKGLPPGPIGNPGDEAIQGALAPTSDGWYYFISLDGKTSEFTKTNQEHQELVDKWNASRKN
ncbi:endolytic transglycosylase MltG [Streptomyces solaniscabiei]|uniref:endolytic transglycosylase MltG n=1 Tax=Streptomyces solaniscabiei TaxID=2683255 RepID=UPI001CE288E0|nr:endolytic transglycosylase MltG [Streptomyces solaniscabiei]